MRLQVPGTKNFIHLNLVDRVFRPETSIKNSPAAHTMRMLECQIENHSGEEPVVTKASATGFGRTRGNESELTAAHENAVLKATDFEEQLEAARAEITRLTERNARDRARAKAFVKRLRSARARAQAQDEEFLQRVSSGEFKESEDSDQDFNEVYGRSKASAG